ncbi:amidohydrolase [Agrococcus jenensis]|uniref:Imidazolonepropionase-like amidohydrolase n=1 Tax=Agrococcus jenensis TaxID=46353 RepID=A0A3N2APR4_9MICO|nr:amidohydrolase [Agrococcus jenensis]ROR65030.1 imidazolonepropionase-like amidohydrolase [Agrococcus jenensis]
MLLAIVNAKVIPVEGQEFDGTIVVRDGRIAELGADVAVPEGAEVLDAAGAQVTPGLVDAHVHLGVHPEGDGPTASDTNEMTNPNTAGVRALDAIDPFDEGFDLALAGGVTTVNVNPGSGNPIGGQAVTLHTHGRIVDHMVLREPAGIKSALGENPKRVYGDKKVMPSTRMGTAKILRDAFVAAQNYQRRLADPDKGSQQDVDLTMEALGKVLRREIPWRQHAHRADDIVTALRLQAEFGYDLIIDHGTEAHVVADLLAERGVPVLIGPLFTTKSKMELRKRSIANPGKLARAGVELSLITDHPVIPISFLVHQASLAVREGLDRETALRAITINPAKALGVAAEVGSLEVGKRADLVVWGGDWMDPMARPRTVLIDGRVVFEHDAATGDERIASRDEVPLALSA